MCTPAQKAAAAHARAARWAINNPEPAETFEPSDSENISQPRSIILQYALTCKPDANACCNKHILEWQPDFVEQKSLVRKQLKQLIICVFSYQSFTVS